MAFTKVFIIHTIIFGIVFAMIVSGGSNGQASNLGVDFIGTAFTNTIFASCVLIIFLVQWMAFIPAFIFKTEHFYDLTGSLTYIGVIILAYMASEHSDIRSLLLTVMVVLWAARLGSYLFLRVLKKGSDSRFIEIKKSFWRFAVTWTIQGLWVLMTAAAALAAITSSEQVEFGLIGMVGVAVWLIGFGFEVVADNQKRQFNQQQNSQQAFIQNGLWSRSRHPNYFGEILLWFGVAIVAFPVLQGWQYITLISPLFVAALLIKVSGIPQQEKQAKERWADNEAYQSYYRSTPRIFPKLF